MVAAVPESRVTEAAQLAIVNFDCGATICQEPQPVSVAFLRYDATLASIRTTPTWRVERKGSRLVASLELLAVLHTNLVVVRDDVSLPVSKHPAVAGASEL